MYDLQAEHDRGIKALQEELRVSQAKAAELQEEVSRKAMEIQYLEQDQEENQEQITRYVQFFGIRASSRLPSFATSFNHSVTFCMF